MNAFIDTLKAYAAEAIAFCDDHPRWATAILAFILVCLISLVRAAA